MSKGKGGVAGQARALTEETIESLGYDLVDLTYVKEGKHWFLRFFIDQRGGIGIEDCETVSRAIDPILDDALDVPGEYILEVSSPGLDRPLKTTRDLLRYRGREVDVSLYAPLEGQRKLSGYIMDATDTELVLAETEPFDENDEPTDAEVRYQIDREQIAKVSQVIKFK